MKLRHRLCSFQVSYEFELQPNTMTAPAARPVGTLTPLLNQDATVLTISVDDVNQIQQEDDVTDEEVDLEIEVQSDEELLSPDDDPSDSELLNETSQPLVPKIEDHQSLEDLFLIPFTDTNGNPASSSVV